MLFKRSYKIFISSVILGELVLNESFRNYKSFSLIFPEHFRVNLMYYESILFLLISDSPLHDIFESENFRFPFLYEK